MKNINEIEITWYCRFHPTNYWHEIGCPHKAWGTNDLQSALNAQKKTNAYHLEILKQHPELLNLH